MKHIRKTITTIWNKLPEKIKKGLQSIYNTPLLLFASLSLLVCILVLSVTFALHDQKENQNPLNTLSGERSHVLDTQVAALYDSLGKVIIDRTNSPHVVSGVDTSTNNTPNQTITSTVTGTGDATATTSTPSAVIYPEDDYAALIIPTTPAYEREYTTSGGYNTNFLPTDPPKLIYPTEAPAATTIQFSFPYGTEVNQSEVLVNIHAGDDTGNSVEASRMTVTLNNVPVEARYTQTNGVVTYALTLTPGTNHLVAAAPNSVGEMSKLEQIIQYTPPSTPTVTVSVEATTVGFGYLVPPTQVPLVENQPISYYVASLLNQYGYEYASTGTIENSFYLAAVGRANAFAAPYISPDLLQAIGSDSNDPSLAQSYNPVNYSPDWLSEFHFTNGSGWLYTVNNQNLNLGMSLVLPTANDSIRVRYSLARGKDIGTYFYSDGTSGCYAKQW